MKNLALVLTITFMTLGANAQYYLGIKSGGGLGGLTTASAYATHYYDINVFYGLAYKQQIFERVMLEGDILLDSRSTIVEYPLPTDNSIVIDAAAGATYISVPLTIHWMTPFRKKELVPYRTGQPKSFFFVEGGPQIMYALSATTYQDPITFPLNLKPETIEANKFDFGLVGGFGVNFGFNKFAHRLVVGTRANYGFLNYNKYKGAPAATNIAFGGYLQWDFSLSKRRYYQYKY